MTIKQLPLPVSTMILQCFAFPPSFGHMGEWLNPDLRQQGCAVWKTKLRTVQGCPFEVILQTTCYHFMWECLNMYSSACRAIYLFAIFSSPAHLREYKRAGKKKRKKDCVKSWDLVKL